MESNGLSMTDEQRVAIMTGADEEAHVRSGLEDTMVAACDEVFFKLRNNEAPSLRVAAYLKAIDRIAASYIRRGQWP